MTPDEIVALYRGRKINPVVLGDAMLACRHALGISQQELARRTGITPGTLHHLESVALMPEPYRTHTAAGRLTLKEARAIADLNWHDDGRAAEIADLFVSGRLSSSWVERVVVVARDDRTATVDELVQRVLSKAPRLPRGWAKINPGKVHPAAVPTATLQAHILALAGEVDAWGMGAHCEVERLPVLAAARVLSDRLYRVVLGVVPVRAPVRVEE